jgi:hypothetical protein
MNRYRQLASLAAIALLALVLTVKPAAAQPQLAFTVTNQACTAQTDNPSADFWLNNTGASLPTFFVALDKNEVIRYHGPVSIGQGELVATDFQAFTGCSTMKQFKDLAMQVFGTNRFAPMAVARGI